MASAKLSAEFGIMVHVTDPMVNLSLYNDRDLPALRAVVARLEEGRPPVHSDHVAEDLGISKVVAARTLRRLIDANFLRGSDVSDFEGEDYFVQAVTRSGLEVSGAWPTPETAMDRLINALEAQARVAGNGERTRLQSAIGTLKSLTKDTAIAVGASIISGNLG